MENLTSFLNKKRKYRKERATGKKNGSVIHIAQSIDRYPKPIQRKVLNIPHNEFKVEYYTPIEVEYEDKNGNPKVFIEPEFTELPRAVQLRERKRTKGMSKLTDIEILYELYGENPK